MPFGRLPLIQDDPIDSLDDLIIYYTFLIEETLSDPFLLLGFYPLMPIAESYIDQISLVG